MNSTRSKKNKAAARRKRRLRIWAAALVLTVCIGAAVCLALAALREIGQRRQGAGYYEDLSAHLVSRPTACPAPAGQEADAPLPAEQPGAQASPEPTWQPRESALDFEPLWEDCPDAVAWIRLEGEWLDYPVVQGEDNEYYLERLPNGYMNEAGSIMLDAANDPYFRDELSILHGHHMNHGSMFGNLDKFREAEYYHEHSSIMLYTPTGDYRIEIAAAWTIDGMEFGYPTQFGSDEEFEAFVSGAKAGSAFDSGVELRRGDRLILLSTCAYDFRFARFVVLGRLIPV